METSQNLSFKSKENKIWAWVNISRITETPNYKCIQTVQCVWASNKRHHSHIQFKLSQRESLFFHHIQLTKWTLNEPVLIHVYLHSHDTYSTEYNQHLQNASQPCSIERTSMKPWKNIYIPTTVARHPLIVTQNLKWLSELNLFTAWLIIFGSVLLSLGFCLSDVLFFWDKLH
jgi:hypothetical protein